MAHLELTDIRDFPRAPSRKWRSWNSALRSLHLRWAHWGGGRGGDGAQLSGRQLDPHPENVSARVRACVRPAWFGAGAQTYPGISEHANGEAGVLPKFLLKSICCFKNKGEVCRGAEECPKGRVQRGHCLRLGFPPHPIPRPLEARLAWVHWFNHSETPAAPADRAPGKSVACGCVYSSPPLSTGYIARPPVAA